MRALKMLGAIVGTVAESCERFSKALTIANGSQYKLL